MAQIHTDQRGSGFGLSEHPGLFDPAVSRPCGPWWIALSGDWPARATGWRRGGDAESSQRERAVAPSKLFLCP